MGAWRTMFLEVVRGGVDIDASGWVFRPVSIVISEWVFRRWLRGGRGGV